MAAFPVWNRPQIRILQSTQLNIKKKTGQSISQETIYQPIELKVGVFQDLKEHREVSFTKKEDPEGVFQDFKDQREVSFTQKEDPEGVFQDLKSQRKVSFTQREDPGGVFQDLKSQREAKRNSQIFTEEKY